MNKKLVLTIISTVYLIILFFGATVVSFNSGEPIVPGFDKVLHFMSFFILAFLLMLTFSHYNVKNKLISTLLLSVAVGLIIEFAQLFIPGRSADIADFWADLAGIALALLLSWGFTRDGRSKP